MRKHTAIYIEALGYHETDFMPCELTGQTGVDLHHIVNRENRIENLMLLTREKHIEFGEIKSKMVYLLESHRQFLMQNGVRHSNVWFYEQIAKYKIYD